MIAGVKGTRDLLPPDTRVWNRVEAVAREVFALYGYDEIRTPVLEATELFVRTVGETTDIVHKEMYTFTDRGGRSVTMRPENTVGVARAYVEHGMAARGVQRLYYIGPQFRYERPQRGRFREFRQIGAEVLGAADPETDYELLRMLLDFLRELELERPKVVLNSVGTEECRPAYVAALREYLAPHASKMGEDDQRRLQQNPLRVLDTKDPELQSILANAPRIGDFLDEESRRHHEELVQLLRAGEIPFEIDPRLVRGLDYYTRTVFEVRAEHLGAQDAVLGGGRYDRLVSDIGGPRTAGIGFAIGEDRLIDALPEDFRRKAIERVAAIALIPLERADVGEALSLAEELRRAKIPIDIQTAAKGPGPGLKAAERRGATFALLLGERERQAGEVVLKNLATRTQESVVRGRLAGVLKELLK